MHVLLTFFWNLMVLQHVCLSFFLCTLGLFKCVREKNVWVGDHLCLIKPLHINSRKPGLCFMHFKLSSDYNSCNYSRCSSLMCQVWWILPWRGCKFYSSSGFHIGCCPLQCSISYDNILFMQLNLWALYAILYHVSFTSIIVWCDIQYLDVLHQKTYISYFVSFILFLQLSPGMLVMSVWGE